MKYLLMAVLITAFQYGNTQDASSLLSDFRKLSITIPEIIGKSDDCSKAIRKNSDIQEQVNELLDKGNLSNDEKTSLAWIKSHSNALGAFMRTVGESGYLANYLKESELSLVKDLIDVEFVEVFKEKKFCCKLFECKMGNYICLLGYKPGKNETYTVKATLQIKNGSSTTTMGLATDRYRRIWSSSNETSFKVTAISCEYNGVSAFKF